jgi:hypothetical protein
MSLLEGNIYKESKPDPLIRGLTALPKIIGNQQESLLDKFTKVNKI